MKVLIADDEITSRLIISKAVKSLGYEPITVNDGKGALNALMADNAPRLAILDWMMPELSGIEVCRKLALRKGRPLVYTILLTSRNEREDLLHALDNGAHDFQIKPVDQNELRCRLQVGTRIIQAEDRISEYALHMEELAKERARQLIHADRLVQLGTLSAGIAHEINNPVCFISNNVQILQAMWQDIEPCIRHCIDIGVGRSSKLEFILQEIPDSFTGIMNGIERVSRIVSGLKRFARKGDALGGRQAVSLNDCLQQALVLCNNVLKYNIKVNTELCADIDMVNANSQEMVQVLVNLISNAADALNERGGGRLTISTEMEEHIVKVTVTDDGPGIPADIISRIFDPFYTTKPVNKGTGLGLPISKSIIEEHNGTLTAESIPGSGASFFIRIPQCAAVNHPATDDLC